MQDNGAIFENIELRESRSNLMRGVYATKDLQKGDQIMFVPRKLVIFKEQNDDTKFG